MRTRIITHYKMDDCTVIISIKFCNDLRDSNYIDIAKWSISFSKNKRADR
jgi:hypothetical protein